MPNCSRCGAPLSEGVRFCPNCGIPQNPSPLSGSQPYAPAAPSKRNNALILLVIIVITVVVIASIGALVVMNAFRQAVNNQVSMSVNSVTDPYNDPVIDASAGNHFILVNLTMGSNQDSMMATVGFFTLEYDVQGVRETINATALTNQTIPFAVGRGESFTFNVGFELPDGALPKKIYFHGILARGEAPIS